uniref:Uncharacterized protein n=1 Tax=Tanacetum cinerariifolium TaxID=118510 RepID=A0A6L2LC49_TANCI|nr:hypothetical protein [Tanacetum cinerariifolium]
MSSTSSLLTFMLCGVGDDEKSGSEDNHNEDDHVTEVENVNENENKTDRNDHSVIEENRKGEDLSAKRKFKSKFNTK